MTEILLYTNTLLIVILIIMITLLLKKFSQTKDIAISSKLESYEKNQEKTERLLLDELRKSRQEESTVTAQANEHLRGKMDAFEKAVEERLHRLADREQKDASENRQHLDQQFKELTIEARQQLEVIEKVTAKEITTMKTEIAESSKLLRQELTQMVKGVNDSVLSASRENATSQNTQLEQFGTKLSQHSEAIKNNLQQTKEMIEQRIAALTSENLTKFDIFREEARSASKHQREELNSSLTKFNESLQKTITDQMQKMGQTSESKLENLRTSVDARLKDIQENNERQLEKMRMTVDEKLQGTLEKRLGESFNLVSQRLEQVHKGLGEMQTLASGVGDLRRVLMNVKVRGGWAELQLERLISEILTPQQYDKNVKVNENSDEAVEFAIKLPGRSGDHRDLVWLPIDAKFPTGDYDRLVDAADKGDSSAIEEAGKNLVNRIRVCAKEICEKYINPPRTTEFAIMFLPTEGLYAEITRRPGLIEQLQRESKVVVAGPSTFVALLNSLQMGFRTLAIEKRSEEVWKLLSVVRTEFGKFGAVLENVKKKLESASDTMDEAAKRSRVIERKLKNVEELPAEEQQLLLAENTQTVDKHIS